MIESASSNPASRKRIDVGSQQVGAVYAKALLGATENSATKDGGQTETVLAEFDVLVAEVLDKYPKLEEVLSSAIVSPEEKAHLIDDVFGPHFSPTLVNLLKVVSHHGRLGALRAIHQEAHKRYDILRGRVRVRLDTAAPINGQVTASLVQTLRKMLGGEPELEAAVEPDLIGGLVLRVGDTVYDGSVAQQLRQIREQIITRSVHEIQSRRDSFRHSG